MVLQICTKTLSIWWRRKWSWVTLWIEKKEPRQANTTDTIVLDKAKDQLNKPPTMLVKKQNTWQQGNIRNFYGRIGINIKLWEKERELILFNAKGILFFLEQFVFLRQAGLQLMVLFLRNSYWEFITQNEKYTLYRKTKQTKWRPFSSLV